MATSEGSQVAVDAEVDRISKTLVLSSTKKRLASLRTLQELLAQQGSKFFVLQLGCTDLIGLQIYRRLSTMPQLGISLSRTLTMPIGPREEQWRTY